MRLRDIPLRDPFVLADQATQNYLLYTEAPYSGTVVHQSKNLVEWSGPTQVYAVPSGGWADPNGGAAAPEVHLYRGRYYLFTTLQNGGTILATAQQAPGPGGYNGNAIWQNQTAQATVIAAADSPLGPFVDLNASSPVTAPSLMTLHGTLHVDPDGTPWTVFAQAWVQKPDAIMAAVRLTADLSAAVADPIWLFKGSNAPWYLDPIYGAPPGGSLANDLQGPPYPTYAPQLYRTPNRGLVMLWSSYRRHNTEYVQTQALSRTGSVAGPWQQLHPIVTGNKGHGMIFEAFDGQLMLALHNNNDNPPDSRAELYDVAITDSGIEVLRHRTDLDGIASQMFQDEGRWAARV
jgi:hypothetical protein